MNKDEQYYCPFCGTLVTSKYCPRCGELFDNGDVERLTRSLENSLLNILNAVNSVEMPLKDTKKGIRK